MMETADRRPLASRNTRWAGAIARWMAARAITPNQISQASMLAAAIAGSTFYLAGQTTGLPRAGYLLLAVLFCQARLLCNLFDGMVAVEGGKGEADGPFWNEFPDRIADLMIFAGVGYGIGMPGLGWAAGAFSVLTAMSGNSAAPPAIPATSPARWQSSIGWQRSRWRDWYPFSSHYGAGRTRF